MTGHELLERLLKSFQSSYDIECPYDINGDICDAYAKFNVTSAKYVLVKSAELWRAHCHEHTFFYCHDDVLEEKNIEKFREQIVSHIEPLLVREGNSCPQKDHMYTYITGIFICSGGVTKEARNAVKKFRFLKNYRFSIRGYSEARILVFDLKDRKVFGNRAAKALVKGYRKVL